MSNIKPKIAVCIDCGPDSQPQPVTAKRCKWHYWEHRRNQVNKKLPEFPKVLKAISKKQSMNNTVYTVLRRVFLRDNPNCLAVREGCSHTAEEVHHKRGRGEYLLKKETFLPVCHNCHVWIENHPEEAKRLGFSEDRLSKNLD